MTRRLNRWLLILIVLLGLPYYWLLIDNHAGDLPAKAVTIAQLRALAASIPGAAPTAVENELVAFRRLSGTLFVSGSGMKRKLVGVMAFRLPVPGKGAIVIDSGMNPAISACSNEELYDAEAQARVDQALSSASLILLTHEHPDHAGGLIALLSRPGGDAVAAKLRVNPAQLTPPANDCPAPWPAIPHIKPTLLDQSPLAVAPGVVVIPAPSHTQGSQLIFVRLADGREYLFAGDISSFALNWQLQRLRSRLMSQYMKQEDRGEVLAWLRTIAALKQQAPKMVVIPGHDFEWIHATKDHHGVVREFQPPPQAAGL